MILQNVNDITTSIGELNRVRFQDFDVDKIGYVTKTQVVTSLRGIITSLKEATTYWGTPSKELSFLVELDNTKLLCINSIIARYLKDGTAVTIRLELPKLLLHEWYCNKIRNNDMSITDSSVYVQSVCQSIIGVFEGPLYYTCATADNIMLAMRGSICR